MAGDEPDPYEDGWVTLAEIAQELRVSPATVRNWVARGALAATRVGQRKLLVQRSELDRMLEESPPGGKSAKAGGSRDVPVWPIRGSLRNRGSQSPGLFPGMQIPAEEAQKVTKELQAAGEVWEAALEASDNAPPDPGFVDRLRDIAAAAERQRDALALAREIPGFRQRPVRDTAGMALSHELRPGANRPGPQDLWTSFDRTVERLSAAMEGTSVALVHIEYVELVSVLESIIKALQATPKAADTRSTKPRRGVH